MKILFVCQYYSPEPFRHPDMCEELVRQGNEVLVVTGTPNYPMGKIYEGYRHGRRKDETVNGVRIHRCSNVARRNNSLSRIFNYYSFVVSSKHYIKKIKEDFDIVLVHQLSPVIMAKAGIKYKELHHVPMVLYCLDLWPESLVMGGINKGGFIFRMIHRASEKIYKSADKVLISSSDFADYFEREFGITDTVHLPQYAEEIFSPEKCFKKPDGKIDLMFAGNVGAAQSVDTIIEAAGLLADTNGLYIHIVGDGSELEKLKGRAAGMPNVIFHGRKPLEEMPEYYSKADAMLVTLKKGELSATLPGKVQSCMAAGKPIIAAADGVTDKTVKEANCGYCSPAEDAAALAGNIRRFLDADKLTLAKNASDYYNEHFGKKDFADHIEKLLKKQIEIFNHSVKK